MELKENEKIELEYMYLLGFRYIARHEIGSVCLFKEKPVRDKEVNGNRGGYDTWVIGKYPIKDHSLYGEINLGTYDFITWENGVFSIAELLV